MVALGFTVNAENVVINGDFEKPVGWRMWGTGGGFSRKVDGPVLLSYDDKEFHGGKKSLKTTDKWNNRRPYVIQFIQVKDMGKAPYILSFWAKGADGAKGRGIIMMEGGGKYRGAISEILNVGKDWKKYTIVIKKLATGTEKIGVAFAATTLDKTETGTLWVDDVVLESASASDIAKAARAGIGKAQKDGLVFYVPFEGNADATFAIADPKPVKNKALTFVEGKFGKGVEIKDSAQLYYKGRAMCLEEGTVAMWVKRNSPWGEKRLYNILVALGGASWKTNSMYLGVTKWNQLRLWTWNDKSKSFTVRSPNGIPYKANEWYHLVVTYEDGNQKIYINGKEISYGVKCTPQTETASDYAKVIRVGSTYTPKCVLNGVVDELRIYNRPLSADEVAKLYTYVPTK